MMSDQVSIVILKRPSGKGSIGQALGSLLILVLWLNHSIRGLYWGIRQTKFCVRFVFTAVGKTGRGGGAGVGDQWVKSGDREVGDHMHD